MTRSDWDAEPPTEVLRTAGAVDTETGVRDDRGHEPPRSSAPTPTLRTPVERVDPVPPAVPAAAPAPPPKRRRRSWMTRLAGADEEILARAPADRPKFVSMGAVLVATAAVAAASASFAMSMAVGLTPIPAILVGLLWGLVILNLDRMLIVSMVTTAGLRRTLVTAIPRVVLAAVIGAIISMPLVLRIFDAEIQVEKQQIQADELSAAQAALNNDVRFTAIPGLETEAARLIGVASGQSGGDVGANEEVKRLREAVAAKEKEYTDTETALICERGGTPGCGSGRAGAGPIYDELVIKLDRLRGERDDLRRQLNEVTTATQGRVDAAAQQQVQVAQSDLTRVQEQLAILRADKARAENDIKEAQKENNGLLIRLQALERLSSGSWMMLAAHGALFLLFVFIEVLPVLMKVLAAAGPPSLYDQLLARREKDALDRADVDSAELRAGQEEERRIRTVEEAERARIAQERAAVPLALEQHRAAAQIEAGKRANLDLAARQEELAQRAIAVWGEVAAARTDKELRDWYERHLDDDSRQAAVQRGTGGPAESRRHQAVSYADFMTRRDTTGRTSRAADPETEEPRGRVGSDDIYRSAAPPPPGNSNGTGPPPEHRTDALPRAGRDPGDEPDGWKHDAVDIASPPAPPPRADR